MKFTQILVILPDVYKRQDVEFDNSMEGYTYTVYLDGNPVYWNGNNIVREELGEQKTDSSVTKTFTSSDEGKTEVYTTTVSKHEITVKAKKDDVELTSVRTFYVSKKGLALGGDMSDKIKLKMCIRDRLRCALKVTCCVQQGFQEDL